MPSLTQNIFHFEFLSLIAVYCILSIFAFGLSKIEEFIRVEGKPKIQIYVPWSLNVFKLLRHFIFALIAFEYVFKPSFGAVSCIIGISLILLGVTLRMVAIRTLGTMWSFHAAVLNDHVVINKGIYKYIKHPAYLGNIYLAGLALTFGSLISSLVAFLIVLLFFLIRIPIEERILFNLSNT